MDIGFASSYLRSLFLTSLFSFVAPLLLMGSTIAGLSIISYVPWLGRLSQPGFELVWAFLRTFGNGNALEGSLVIGSTCGLVGALFDTYIFYRQNTFRR
ncbi:MAG: hypothetical protein HC780_25355 [Leptolyngbyaceae cyanobacterium CSU_1_3]|nr:hypothetical protein [Leptolyngbyaceae cyanobacterium CSU_1_3]